MNNSKLKLDGLLNLDVIPIYQGDVEYICDNNVNKDEFKKIIESILGLLDSRELKKFLIENKDHIDIGRLVVLTAVRSKLYIDIINEIINSQELSAEEILEFKNKISVLEKTIRQLKSYYNKMDEVYLSLMSFDKDSKDYNVTVYNSDEIIRGKNKKKNEKRFKKINNIFKENGLDSICYALKLGDLKKIFLNDELGKKIIISIESKIASKIGKTKFNYNSSLEEIHNSAKTVLKGDVSTSQIDEVVNEELAKYAKYIDIDKLLLICAFRMVQFLDDEKHKDNAPYEKILREIQSSIEKVSEVFYVSEYDDESMNEAERKEVVQYSTEELKTDLSRFINGEYWSYDRINDEKSKIKKGSVPLGDIHQEVLNIMSITTYEIEKAMQLSVDNFLSGVRIFNYDVNKIGNFLVNNTNIAKEEAINPLYNNGILSIHDILHLYKNNFIGKENLTNLSQSIDFSSEINLNKIKQKYFDLKIKKNVTQEERKSLDFDVKIYRLLFFDSMEDNEKDKTSDNLMYEIFDDEEAIEYFFEEGIITLNVLADWTGEDLIKKLFKDDSDKNDNKTSIKISDIGKLYERGKVSQQFLENLILSTNPDIDQMIEYMKKKYISEKNIIKLFEEENIYSNLPSILLKQGVISQSTYEILISRSIRNLERRTKQSLSHLEDLEDDGSFEELNGEMRLPLVASKSELRTENRKRVVHHHSKNKNTNKTVIKAEAIKHLLMLFGCKVPRVVKYESMGDKNPLYNYEFFVLQRDYTKKEIDKDDIIIANRFYKDREKQLGDAVDNAAFVMKYEDYLILQGKQIEKSKSNKREMINEIDGAVYAVYHKNGVFAKSLLKALTQIDEGHKLNGYSSSRSTRKKMLNWLEDGYEDEQILYILDMIARIDNGDYTVEADKDNSKRDDSGAR